MLNVYIFFERVLGMEDSIFIAKLLYCYYDGCKVILAWSLLVMLE